MRSLKVKQYKYRLEQFMKTFESEFPLESVEYDRDVESEFNKVLAAENIAPVDWCSVFDKPW